MIGVTGVSGSGKSSLIFDVLAAEGHRKYVESLSTKVRQALEKVSKPDVDYVEGLSPVLSIEQISARGAGPRSTVATATEIADYARLLCNCRHPHCPKDGEPVTRMSLDLCGGNHPKRIGEKDDFVGSVDAGESIGHPGGN